MHQHLTSQAIKLVQSHGSSLLESDQVSLLVRIQVEILPDQSGSKDCSPHEPRQLRLSDWKTGMTPAAILEDVYVP